MVCEQVGELALALARGRSIQAATPRARGRGPAGKRAVRHVAREDVLERNSRSPAIRDPSCESTSSRSSSRPAPRRHARSRRRGDARPNRSRTPAPRRTRTGVRSVRPPAAGRCARRAPPDGVGDDDLADVLGRPPTAAVANDPALVDEMADDLLQEERVPVGAREDRLSGLVGQVVHGEEHFDEGRRVAARQRFEEDRTEVALPASPAGPGRARSGREGQTKRSGPATRPASSSSRSSNGSSAQWMSSMTTMAGRSAARPVKYARQASESRAAPGAAGGRPARIALLEPERKREDSGRTCGIGNGSEDVLFETGDLGERSLGRIRVEHTRVRLEHLAERPVGDRLAVRQAAALQHPRRRRPARPPRPAARG